MKTSRTSLSRRRFLKGAGGTAALMPLLSSARARGQTSFPKRLVVVQTPNGVIPADWFPTPGATAFDFVLGANHQPLQPFRERMVILEGIDMPSVNTGPGEPHQKGMGGVLTGRGLLSPSDENGAFVGGDGSLAGWGSGKSVDQRVADIIGATTKHKSLQLGVRATTAEVRSRLSYLDAALPLPPIIDPVDVFHLLFADVDVAPDLLVKQRRERRSVLDLVMNQFAAVKARVGPEDRQKLEQHLTMVRDLERRLDAPLTMPDCAPLIAPQSIPVDDETTMPAVSALQIDLIAAAFACDVTRVVTLQYSNAQNHIRFPWVSMDDTAADGAPSLGDGHNLSHAGPSSTLQQAEHSARVTWYASQVATLLTRLDAAPEGAGTVLDNTLVMWVNELAVGNTHSQQNMPFVLFGGAGGALVGGRHVVFNGASHNDLLTAIVHTFGGVDASFGDPTFCAGPLSGIFS